MVDLQMSDPAADLCIYERGKVSNQFVLILNGTVQIDVGNDNFTFAEGPFSFYGLKVLSGVRFFPPIFVLRIELMLAVFLQWNKIEILSER